MDIGVLVGVFVGAIVVLSVLSLVWLVDRQLKSSREKLVFYLLLTVCVLFLLIVLLALMGPVIGNQFEVPPG